MDAGATKKGRTAGKGTSLQVASTDANPTILSSNHPDIMNQMMVMQQMQMQQMLLTLGPGVNRPAANVSAPIITSGTPVTPLKNPVVASPSPKRPHESPLHNSDTDLEDWLIKLDSDKKRNKQGFCYSSLAPAMLEKALFELSDVVNLSPEKLIELVGPDLRYGHAQRIVAFAGQDSGLNKRARC